MTEHNHKQCVTNALKIAEDICTARGVQLTPIRYQILELIWESHKPVKAYDLLERVRPLAMAAKPPTIYRALEFLFEQGLIHRIESLNAFIGCSCANAPHEQLLLICKNCQEVEERPAPKVMQALNEEFNDAKFIAHSKAIEIHGLCSDCAEQTLSNRNLKS